MLKTKLYIENRNGKRVSIIHTPLSIIGNKDIEMVTVRDYPSNKKIAVVAVVRISDGFPKVKYKEVPLQIFKGRDRFKLAQMLIANIAEELRKFEQEK